ncbi:unnamed protein product [Cylindrotheca closterium]|uniref:Uncharacterized protein n=1 Tax=Cylindrotheca closterium TaxID=2856 RepID=A0AAD2CYA4_9STRA|nr:unnamed protein product [Cylindrotheca closterium]
MTIDQNDLLVECFKNGADDHDSGFVVHFFSDHDADSISISQEIDSYLETRLFDAIMTSSAWKCRRVNARLAPVVTKILDIDPDQPTVVAIKHGVMVTKQT